MDIESNHLTHYGKVYYIFNRIVPLFTIQTQVSTHKRNYSRIKYLFVHFRNKNEHKKDIQAYCALVIFFTLFNPVICFQSVY